MQWLCAVTHTKKIKIKGESSSAAFQGRRKEPRCALFPRRSCSRWSSCFVQSCSHHGTVPGAHNACQNCMKNCLWRTNPVERCWNWKILRSLQTQTVLWFYELQEAPYHHDKRGIVCSRNKLRSGTFSFLKITILLFLTPGNSTAEFIAWEQVTGTSPETSDLVQCLKWWEKRSSRRNLSFCCSPDPGLTTLPEN